MNAKDTPKNPCPEMLEQGEKLAAVLRWYLVKHGNAGGAQYALQAWAEYVAQITGSPAPSLPEAARPEPLTVNVVVDERAGVVNDVMVYRHGAAAEAKAAVLRRGIDENDDTVTVWQCRVEED